jgi:hypothetical protein
MKLYYFFSSGFELILLVILSIILPKAIANSESEKWSWPTSAKDRKDIFYESVSGNERVGRIRVPTSYYDNGR